MPHRKIHDRKLKEKSHLRKKSVKENSVNTSHPFASSTRKRRATSCHRSQFKVKSRSRWVKYDPNPNQGTAKPTTKKEIEEIAYDERMTAIATVRSALTRNARQAIKLEIMAERVAVDHGEHVVEV